MREILTDMETTGEHYEDGHRIIEIACVEISEGQITGKTYHQYINPERELDPVAIEAHGIQPEFLDDKPVFGEISNELLEFIGDAVLVAHNASFDIGFLNSELKKIGRVPIDENRTVIDTLVIANELFPEQPNNLDALCDRLNIDYDNRNSDGALLDAELMAEIYLEIGKLNG